jgi:hypothetical protein
VREHGEDRGDLGRDGLEGVNLADGGSREGAAEGDVAQEEFLQGKLERRNVGVGVDELVEGFEERRESGGAKGF